MNDTTPDSLIDLAEAKGACRPALNWLRKKPRTFDELLKHDIDWVVWAVENIGPEFTDRLTNDQITDIAKRSPWIAAGYLGNRLTDDQVAIVMERAPSAAATFLADRLTDDQVAVVMERATWIAAEYLGGRLTDEQVGIIVERDPGAAAEYLRDRAR
jgi:hypothetical protein